MNSKTLNEYAMCCHLQHCHHLLLLGPKADTHLPFHLG